MKRILFICIPLAFWLTQFALGQPAADKKLAALEQSLTAEQKRLLDEWAALQSSQQIRYFDPTRGIPIKTAPQIRAELLELLATMSPQEAKGFWRSLPKSLKQSFRLLNPLEVSVEERKAAAALPAATKEVVAQLLSDDLDIVLAARRKILAFGPACRALLVDQLASLTQNSPKRLRHEELLKRLEYEEAHQGRVRIAEAAMQKASRLEEARGNNSSTIAVLVSRGICDVRIHSKEDAYGSLYHYNFIQKNHEYETGVGLGLGNGDGNTLIVNMFGGQDNRLFNLGPVPYAEVKKAPGPDKTAKWWKRHNNGPPMTAVVGHVYLLHLVDAEDKVDFAVKFKVLDLSDDEWVIIEWERIPQEK